MAIQCNEVSSSSAEVFSTRDMWEKLAALPEFQALPDMEETKYIILGLLNLLEDDRYTAKDNDWGIIPFMNSMDDVMIRGFESVKPGIRQTIEDYKWDLDQSDWVKSSESGSDCSVI